MKNVLFIFLFLCSCTTEPQPLVPGRDECSNCKMVVMDERFGAEIITVKGKIFKFDDVICMIRFMKSGSIGKKDMYRAFVMNYLQKNNFINVDQAFFLLSPDLHSPMNGNTAAFVTTEEAAEVALKMKGETFRWVDLFNKLN